MAERFLNLSNDDRREALNVASSAMGRPASLLEKDVWVVWTLETLFSAPFGDHLAFKGGTSLSKAYHAIQRFSEDVDLTYDIRELVPDLARPGTDAIPPTGSQAGKWTRAVRAQLPVWIETIVVPVIKAKLLADGLQADLTVGTDTVHIAYPTVTEAGTYVQPKVLLEFGARSTGEPCETIAIVCDAAEHLPSLSFPKASPRVMRAERTFWEKATAMHAYCLKGAYRGERFARHWYDLARLYSAGIAASAVADRALARSVAEHKTMFFAENDAKGDRIDYGVTTAGGILLIPEDAALDALAADFKAMVDEGLLEGEIPDFDELLRLCKAVQDDVNNVPRSEEAPA